MTQREKEIYQMIVENPMISQKELAEKMGIMRSSVAVHISNLIAEGVLKGRGYIIAEQNRPLVIGASNVDFFCNINRSGNTAATENCRYLDAQFEISYGGIAKNVAEGLVRLGSAPMFITAVGHGLLGQEIVRDCQEANISTSDIMLFGEPTAAYLEVWDPLGEKSMIALANSDIYNSLSPENLINKRYAFNHASLVLMEDTLPIETLQFLSSTYAKNQPMLLCTYPERTEKYQSFIEQFCFVIMSDEIAFSLLKQQWHPSISDGDVIRACKELHRIGLTGILIVFGGSGMCYVKNNHGFLAHFNVDYCEGDSSYIHCRDTIASSVIKSFEDNLCASELLHNAAAARYLVSQTKQFVCKSLCPSLITSTREKGRLTIAEFEL